MQTFYGFLLELDPELLEITSSNLHIKVNERIQYKNNQEIQFGGRLTQSYLFPNS